MTIELIPGALARAITAAETLGLETAQARAVARTIEERGGYPGELYVLGLAGGTGVGKSSLLNAIAGGEVSPAGARRPTTTAPVALLPVEYEAQAAPLLEWLGGAEARTWAGGGAADGAAVAIVDLPDLDSVEPAHAARVDAVLPRIDAVVWVTDPEKYDDAVLHDRYLRRWMPRLARQALVVNKSDRLTREDIGRVCEDLRARLRAEGLPEVPVLGVSARNDPAPLRDWLREGVSAKEIVRARLQQSALDAVRELATAAGAADPSAPGPLVAPTLGDQAAAVSRDALLDLLGPRGLRDQAKAAVWTEARSRGGGPIERGRTLLERGSGVTARRADPEGYLRRWRERGSLDRATAPVRQVLLAAAGSLPAPMRPNVLAGADPAVVGERLTRGLDAVVRGAAVGPRSAPQPALACVRPAAARRHRVGRGRRHLGGRPLRRGRRHAHRLGRPPGPGTDAHAGRADPRRPVVLVPPRPPAALAGPPARWPLGGCDPRAGLAGGLRLRGGGHPSSAGLAGRGACGPLVRPARARMDAGAGPGDAPATNPEGTRPAVSRATARSLAGSPISM